MDEKEGLTRMKQESNSETTIRRKFEIESIGLEWIGQMERTECGWIEMRTG